MVKFRFREQNLREKWLGKEKQSVNGTQFLYITEDQEKKFYDQMFPEKDQKEKFLSYLDYPNSLLMDEAECSIRPVAKAQPKFQLKEPPLRLPDCYGGCINVFNSFAGKTYAPSTELSRSQGAGANSIDED